jgi:hypothetical protein
MHTTGSVGLGRQLYSDRSVTALLLSKLLTILLALFQQWTLPVSSERLPARKINPGVWCEQSADQLLR